MSVERRCITHLPYAREHGAVLLRPWRLIARQDGSAIDVKTGASPLPVNKRPCLGVEILTSN